jgi:hypothetical protein
MESFFDLGIPEAGFCHECFEIFYDEDEMERHWIEHVVDHSEEDEFKECEGETSTEKNTEEADDLEEGEIRQERLDYEKWRQRRE